MIRSGSIEDLHLLVELESLCFGAQAWSSALLATALTDAHTLVADRDGYVTVRVVADVADLDRIAVRPQARGRGLGKELLVAGRQRARALGAERMMLEVAADNTVAVRLYQSVGFVEIHRRRGYYPGGVDAIVMESPTR